MTPTNFDPRPHLIQLKRYNKKTGQTTTTEYLPVAYRLQWFRIEQPSGKIESKLVHLDTDKGQAVFSATVEREDGGTSTMFGSETAADWGDYIEKANTKALGRALAACGYGSQFCDEEFDEGERIVDSPVPMRQSATSESASARTTGPLPPANEQEEKATGDDLAAIKQDVRTLGLARNPEQWTTWKKQITKRNLADQDLTTVHLRMMRIAVEQARQSRAEQSAA